MPVQPDLLKRDQIKVIPPRIPYCRCPVRQRQADHKERDQHIEDKTVYNQSPVLRHWTMLVILIHRIWQCEYCSYKREHQNTCVNVIYINHWILLKNVGYRCFFINSLSKYSISFQMPAIVLVTKNRPDGLFHGWAYETRICKLLLNSLKWKEDNTSSLSIQSLIQAPAVHW